MDIPIDKCPNCGNDEEFYVKVQFGGSGHSQVRFDGKESEDGALHDNITYEFGKWAYCSNCGKRLFKVDM